MNKLYAFFQSFLTVIIFLMALLLLDRCLNSSEAADLSDVHLEYRRYTFARSPLFYNSEPKEYLALVVNTNLYEYLYYNNRVHAGTDQTQFHLVGLETHLGIRLTEEIDIEYVHHSQHILDNNYPGFPTEDSIGVNIYLYSVKRRSAF